jgi:hypothetical protein
MSWSYWQRGVDLLAYRIVFSYLFVSSISYGLMFGSLVKAGCDSVLVILFVHALFLGFLKKPPPQILAVRAPESV